MRRSRGPELDHASAVEDQDIVGALHCAQPVGDDEGRSSSPPHSPLS